MSAASDNLRTNQKQLDMDGCMVGVSREALETVLAERDSLLVALKALDAALCDGFATQAARMSGRKALIAARAAVAMAEQTEAQK